LILPPKAAKPQSYQGSGVGSSVSLRRELSRTRSAKDNGHPLGFRHDETRCKTPQIPDPWHQHLRKKRNCCEERFQLL